MRKSAIFSVLILCALNVVIFYHHYFADVTFPWDFVLSYLGIVAFGTTAVANGQLPEWMPFQSMGYPFLVNPQNEFFYPPFQLIGFAGLKYDLHLATAVQCMHILAAGVGAFLLAAMYTRRATIALFAGSAYMMFGGFYSNAQHPDIIRAWCWLPWLLAAVTPPAVESSRSWRHYVFLAIPLLIVLHTTGGYPGNLVAHMLGLGVYLAALFAVGDGVVRRLLVRNSVAIGIGIVISAPAVVPSLFLKSQFAARDFGYVRFDWNATNWITLVAPWDLPKLSLEISMRSAYVGVAVVLLALLGIRLARRHFYPVMACGLFAFVMLAGMESPVYRLIGALFPLAKVSRHASSDYRALFALSLIIVATFALEQFSSLKAVDKRSFLRGSLLVLVVAFCLFVSGQWDGGIDRVSVIVIVSTFATVVALLFASGFEGRFADPVVTLLVLNTFAGYWTVNHAQRSWFTGSVYEWYRTERHLEPEPSAQLVKAMVDPPARRDVRHVANIPPSSWHGYLAATYEMGDLGGFVTSSRNAVEHDPVLSEWMARPSAAIVIPAADVGVLDCDTFKRALAGTKAISGSFAVTRYGVDDIHYAVQLAEPSFVVENELYFPGWEGKRGDSQSMLSAVPTCDALRTWRLDAGAYTFETNYRTPYLRFAFVAAGGGAALYLAMFFVGLPRRKTAVA